MHLGLKTVIPTAVVLVLTLSCARLPVTRPDQAMEGASWWSAGTPEDDLQFRELAAAVRQSMEYYMKLPPDTTFLFGPDRAAASDLLLTLQNFLLLIENESLSYEQKVKRIRSDFVLYRSVGSDGGGRVLFTGYYEPVLSCRSKKDDIYKYPLYKRPDDIIEVDLTLFGNGFPKNRIFGRLENKKIIPYYSRQEIDHKKVLQGRALELLWCNDPVDVYFLQVQGSGRADLGGGNVAGVLYDGQNGRPYRSIGRYLMDAGAISKENMSMHAIRSLLSENPGLVPDVLNQNPSYVFFRLDAGPAVGSLGLPLTAGRSIATDQTLFPKGALGMIETEKPVIADDGTISEWVPFTRFVLNQDTGGAIRGPGRADLFWGLSKEAETAAGYMQQEGELYFLLLRKNYSPIHEE